MNSRGLAGPVADRVGDQVLKNLLQMEFVDVNAGKSGAADGSAAVFDGGLKVCQRLVQDLIGVDIFRRLRPCA